MFALEGKELDVYNLQSNECHQVTVFDSRIMDYRVTADAKQVISVHDDGSIRLSDVTKGKELERSQPLFFSPNASPRTLSISSDSELAAVSVFGGTDKRDSQAIIYRLPKLAKKADYSLSSAGTHSIAFNPKTPMELAMPSGKKAVTILDTERSIERSQTLELPSRVLRLVYSPDGKILVITCLEGFVQIVRQSKAIPITKYPDPPYAIRDVAISADSKLLALLVAADSAEIYVFDLESLKPYKMPSK
jgi:WD40 repeat protein